MTDPRIIHAYRHLYRQLLHAVKFSKPARFVARDQLRAAFRDKNAKFDPRNTTRTVRFLEAAARTRGLEHSILKNLLMVAYDRTYGSRTAYKQYDMTVAMLNKSLGLCLR
ncbi:hypothetical protein K445DRAFT_74783 [Daldinia sp. EC12]|nr:hypothetical protein K445DRAFT_74783 [Daldinia sp. EC12]